TLASPPPNVAMNCGDCRRRSYPGGASRSIISPNVTTKLDIEARFYQISNLQLYLEAKCLKRLRLNRTKNSEETRKFGGFLGSFRKAKSPPLLRLYLVFREHQGLGWGV